MRVYFTKYHYRLHYTHTSLSAGAKAVCIKSFNLCKIRKTAIPNLYKRRLRLREVRWLLEKQQKTMLSTCYIIVYQSISVQLIKYTVQDKDILHKIKTLFCSFIFIVFSGVRKRTTIITHDLPNSLIYIHPLQSMSDYPRCMVAKKRKRGEGLRTTEEKEVMQLRGTSLLTCHLESTNEKLYVSDIIQAEKEKWYHQA